MFYVTFPRIILGELIVLNFNISKDDKNRKRRKNATQYKNRHKGFKLPKNQQAFHDISHGFIYTTKEVTIHSNKQRNVYVSREDL